MRAALTGCLLALAIAAPADAAQQQVLYVGDSLGVGTTPLLTRALGSSARVHGDSRIGRPSGEGLRVLQQTFSPSDQIVVFDLGTNDDPAAPRTLASDLAAARHTTGDRCLIVATLNRPPLNGVSVDGLNQAVLAFASGAKNVQLVDWNAIAQSEPSLLGPDHVHPTPQGYALRAQLFSEAVAACSSAPADQGDSLALSPSPAAKKKRRAKPPKPVHHIKVPGIESSGISFTEPLRGGQLLLPNTKPPYTAVVMVGGTQGEAEFFAAHGIATLVTRGSIRAGVAQLAKRGDIRRAGIAVWGFGDAPARAAAGDRRVAAVVAMSPSALPAEELRDWRARRDADAPAVTTWLRVRGDDGDAPGPWTRVAQPLLAIWGTRDTQLPVRASADALRRALAAGPNRDRTFRWFDTTHAGHAPGQLEETARWLGLHLGERRAKPVVNDSLPPANPGPKPVDVNDASAIYSKPIQALWLLIPALLLAAAAIRASRASAAPAAAGSRLAAAALAAGIACAAAIAAGIALTLDSGSVAQIAGTPWPFALAFVFTAALLACSIAAAARRAWLVTAGGGVWLALALFWLL